VVGKYLNDSTGASRSAIIPTLFDRKRYNEDGVSGMHVYTPWWLDNKKLDFPRGYHIEYGGGMGMPTYGFGWGIEGINGKYARSREGIQMAAGGYGAKLKEDYRRFYGSYVLRDVGNLFQGKTIFAKSTRTPWTNTVFLCCDSITNGAITKSNRPSTCTRLLSKSSMKWVVSH
jgi:hypothetical protein